MKVNKGFGLRGKFLLAVVSIVILFGVLSSSIGTWFINTMTMKEAQMNIENNIQGAWEILNSELESMSQCVYMLCERSCFVKCFESIDSHWLHNNLSSIKSRYGFDFLTVTDADGTVILRSSISNSLGDNVATDDFVRDALSGKPQQGFTLLSPERMDRESENLSQKAYTLVRQTPHQKSSGKKKEVRGMVMYAISPIVDENKEILGTIYAGILLNRNNDLVDRISSVLFGQADNDKSKNRAGSVTFFLGDVRVATNVRDENNLRAIGTRVSAEVSDRTLDNGLRWNDRAFVVKDWYISAYDPIKNHRNEVIGMLYVGTPENKYSAMKGRLFLIFNVFSTICIIIIIILSRSISKNIITPLRKLTEAAEKASSGTFDIEIPELKGSDEICELTAVFRQAFSDIRAREEDIIKVNNELTAANKHYMELLSFVTHDLKNQITGASIWVRTLQRSASRKLSRADEDILNKLWNTMNYLGELMQNYLDLSRLETGDHKIFKRRLNFLSEVVIPSIDRISMQIDKKSILIKNHCDSNTFVNSDQVFLSIIYNNLLHNAVKYCDEEGIIKLSSKVTKGFLEFEVWNEGEGISQSEIDLIFEKFYPFDRSNRPVSSGSGLGLFISKKLIDMLEGTIKVESSDGKWVSFVVSIPDIQP